MTAESLHLTQPPIAEAAMLIRRPVDEVFEAFVDPAITAKFWFTKGSGRLEPGAHVQWDWEMYDVSAQVDVKEVKPNERIRIEWPTTVEWRFTPRPDNTTFVTITEAGFRGDGDDVVNRAIGSTAAFTMVLDALKAFLEHDISLNLIADRFPDGLEAG
jgi:uncharacterized protein YndB with AHSA1/START domain